MAQIFVWSKVTSLAGKRFLDPEGNQDSNPKLCSCLSIISLCIEFKTRHAYDFSTCLHILLELSHFSERSNISSLYFEYSPTVNKCLVDSNQMVGRIIRKAIIDCENQMSQETATNEYLEAVLSKQSVCCLQAPQSQL